MLDGLVSYREKQSQSRLRKASGYLYLLVSANPSKLDIALLAIGVISAIGAGIPFPLLFILYGQLVDQLNSNSCAADGSTSDNAFVVNRVLDVIYVTIANFVLIYLFTGAWSLFGERLVRRLRYAYLEALLRQDIAYFETLPAGEVASRLDSDLHTIQAGVSEKVGILIQSISYFVAAYVVAFIMDAKLAGMMFSLVPAYFIMALGGNYFTKKYSAIVSEKVTAANSIASEALSHIRLVKAFGAAKRIETIFVQHLAGTRGAAIGKLLTAAVQMGLLYFIAYSANALAISQGGDQIADSIASGKQDLTVGHVYTVIFVLVDGKDFRSQAPSSWLVDADLRWQPRTSSAKSLLFSTYLPARPHQPTRSSPR
jgi:ATP-binding cassette, subfamily B (MDR/TAP), member 1